MSDWLHCVISLSWIPVGIAWIVTNKKKLMGFAGMLCPKVVQSYLARKRELACVRLAFETTTKQGETKRFDLKYRMPPAHCNPTDLRSTMTNLFGDKDGDEGYAGLRDFVCFHLTETDQITLASNRTIHEMVITCDEETFSLVEAALCARKLTFVQRAQCAHAA